MKARSFSQEEGGVERFSVVKSRSTEPLRECVRDALRTYFQKMEGHDVHGLYQLIMAEVEAPLLQSVMEHTRGNQTRAASTLGISRSTLRKKLTHYGLE